MKPKFLFTLTAIYMGLGGLGFLVSPTTVVFGLDAGASALLIADIRTTASTFLGIAILNWLARNAETSKARDAIFLANTVGFGLAAILSVFSALAGGGAVAWVFFVVNLLFTVAFFVVGRANMSTSAT